MEIHFEPPFDKSFVNLCVFTFKWVGPLIKAYILADSLFVQGARKKQKRNYEIKLILISLGTQMKSSQGVLEFPVSQFRKHCSGLQW